MTIKGELGALVDVVEPGFLANPDLSGAGYAKLEHEFAESFAGELLPVLEGGGLEFDTDTGVVVYENNSDWYVEINGNNKVERSLLQWVEKQMFDLDVGDIHESSAPLVVNTLHRIIRERNLV